MKPKLDFEYVLDMNGGADRFPQQPGIYALVFNPGDDGRLYVGASVNVRSRIKTHIKAQGVPAWANRLARELLKDELLVEPEEDLRLHPQLWRYQAYARRSTDAKVLELFDFGTADRVIEAAENRWMAELSPALNAPDRAKGGYCRR